MSNETEIDDGGTAFPAMYSGGLASTAGMSLRDYFAGQALASLSREERDEDFNTIPGIASYCYIIADAMIAERAKR